METPGLTAAPSARTSHPLAPKISPLLPGSDVARTRRERVADLGDQLLTALVHADHGSAGIVWAMVHFQHIFHCSHECGRGPRGQAPAFLQPRLELVFFRVRRTVS